MLLLGLLISQIVFKTVERHTSIAIVVGFVFIIVYYVYLKKYKVKNNEENSEKNKLLLLFFTIIEFITMLGFFVECSYTENLGFIISASIINCAITFLFNSVLFYLNESRREYKYLILIEFTIMYILAAVFASNWVFFVSLPMIAICTIYGKTKFLIIAGVVQNLATIFSCICKVAIMPKSENPAYFAAIYITVIAVHITFTIVIIRTSKMIGFINSQKRGEMIKGQEKLESLSREVIDIGIDLKQVANNTYNIIEQIEHITQEMSITYNDISGKNEVNTVSAKEQEKMTLSITDMISRVDLEVDIAKEATKISENSINKSKNSVCALKAKSQLLLEYNKEIALSFNTLLKNIKGINNIITGIFEISEQTNVLALNASIESVKAGESRKSFEVVASQIRNLSEATLQLMLEMKNIIQNLQNSALRVRNTVTEMMGLVENENNVINATINGLDNMGNSISSLSKNIENISHKVEKVLEHSKKIDESSKEIALFSNTVEESTRDSLAMNNENKETVLKTKEVMLELDNVAEELSAYQ